MPDTPPDLSRYAEIELDCESDGVQWFKKDRPIAWAVHAEGQSWYLPFGHRGGGNLDEETVKRWAQRELRDKRINNHSLRFDMHMSRAWGVDLAEQNNTFHDVAHSEALLDDHCRDFSLDAIAMRRLGMGKLESDNKAEIVNRPAWDMAPYGKQDVELIANLVKVYRPLLDADGLNIVSQLEDEVIPVTVEMEHNGCPIDEELLDTWVTQSTVCLEELLWKLSRLAGFQVNPDSPDHLMRLFKVRGIDNPHRTKTGAPSFAASFVKTVQDEAIQACYKAGKLIDLRNKFLLPYTKLIHNGYLYASFHQLMTSDESHGLGGTVSGRYSSARPNLQQVMKPGKQKKDYGVFEFTYDGVKRSETFIIKKLFREPDGGTWFCADQEAVEFRIFIHFSGAQRLIQKYFDEPAYMEFDGRQVAIAGPHTDPHAVVCVMIRTKRPGFPRDDAKNSNFARVYGSGVTKFAIMMDGTEDEAQEVLDIYDAAFPEAKATLNRAKKAAEDRGWVKTLLGRRCRFPLMRQELTAGKPNGTWVPAAPGERWGKRQRTHKALNAVVQGSAADINKRCLVETYKERKRLGFLMRLTVHDELNGRLEDPAMAPAVMAVLNTQHIPLSVPILWSGGSGATWADAK